MKKIKQTKEYILFQQDIDGYTVIHRFQFGEGMKTKIDENFAKAFGFQSVNQMIKECPGLIEHFNGVIPLYAVLSELTPFFIKRMDREFYQKIYTSKN